MQDQFYKWGALKTETFLELNNKSSQMFSEICDLHNMKKQPGKSAMAEFGKMAENVEKSDFDQKPLAKEMQLAWQKCLKPC